MRKSSMYIWIVIVVVLVGLSFFFFKNNETKVDNGVSQGEKQPIVVALNEEFTLRLREEAQVEDLVLVAESNIVPPIYQNKTISESPTSEEAGKTGIRIVLKKGENALTHDFIDGENKPVLFEGYSVERIKRQPGQGTFIIRKQ